MRYVYVNSIDSGGMAALQVAFQLLLAQHRCGAVRARQIVDTFDVFIQV